MASIVVFTLASAVILASAQVVPGCTTNSFAIPSWWINDLKTSSDNASFKIINRANNDTAALACAFLKDSPSTCAVQGPAAANSPSKVTVQLAQASRIQMTVNQTWQCHDRSNLTFTAVGGEEVPLKCTGQACEALNAQHLIKGSLLKPVVLTPQYAAGPPGHDFRGCAGLAMKPVWDVSNVEYIEPTGDGLDTDQLRTFSMLIRNNHTGYMASCFSGDLGIGGAPTESGIVCAGMEFNDLGPDRYRISTTAAWDATKSELRMKQIWYCDDVNPGKPVMVTTSAVRTLELKCTNRPIPGIPNGNERTCVSGDNIMLTGKLDSTTPLPPYSLTDPLPVADGCTISSIIKPAWTFSNFRIYDTVVSFDIILQASRRGFATPIGITRHPRIPGMDNFYICAIDNPDSNVCPLWPTSCLYRYEELHNKLTLKATWICSDLDPKHPVEFTGLTTTKIESAFVCEEDAEGRTECMTENPGYTWTEEMTGVTWQPAPQPA